jgi:hypothetical protein
MQKFWMDFVAEEHDAVQKHLAVLLEEEPQLRAFGKAFVGLVRASVPPESPYFCRKDFWREKVSPRWQEVVQQSPCLKEDAQVRAYLTRRFFAWLPSCRLCSCVPAELAGETMPPFEQSPHARDQRDRQDDDAVLAALDLLAPSCGAVGLGQLRDAAGLHRDRAARAIGRLKHERLVVDCSILIPTHNGARRHSPGIRRTQLAASGTMPAP